MSDNRVAEAVDIVARGVIVRLAEWGLGDAWGDHCPDIGEYDWERVDERIKTLLSQTRPDRDAFEAANQFLASRAENES